MTMDTITRSYERSAQLSLFRQVYLWMAMALVITGFMAMLVAESPTLLSLIFSSKLESAKRFKHWVTKEKESSVVCIWRGAL